MGRAPVSWESRSCLVLSSCCGCGPWGRGISVPMSEDTGFMSSRCGDPTGRPSLGPAAAP